MKKRIFASVFFTSLLLLFFGLASVLILSEMIVSSDAKEKLIGFTNDLADNQDSNTAGNFLQGKKFGLFRVTLILPNGEVYYDSFSDSSKMKNHGDRQEVKNALNRGTGDSERYSSSLDKKTIYHAVRLKNGEVLRCAITYDTIFRQIKILAYMMLGIVFLSLIISALIARFLTEKIVRPINRIDLTNPEKKDVYDEISPLIKKISTQKEQIKKQFADIRQKTEEFLIITDRMTEGLIILNQNIEIVSINHSARNFLEVDNSCIGKSLLAVDRSSFARDIFSDKTQDISFTRKLERNDRYYLVFFNKIVVDNTFNGYALLLVDITDSKMAEKQRKEFTANVSHELKSPLQSVIGSAELMENGLVDNKDIPEFAKKIRKKSLRLLSLINDIIFLSRLDEGRHGGEQPVRLTVVATDVFEMLHDKAAQKNITLQKTVEDFEIYGIYQYFHELIFNLIDNSIKYNIEYGKVFLEIKRDSEHLEIKVSDSGIGIPQNELPRVFERFYRVDKSHSSLIEGTGLGLSIVKRIALHYGGKIDISSVEQQGTQISVFIPIKNITKKEVID